MSDTTTTQAPAPVFAKGDRVATDTGVTGTVAWTYTNAKGEVMVKVTSASYARGSHSIKATRLYHL